MRAALPKQRVIPRYDLTLCHASAMQNKHPKMQCRFGLGRPPVILMAMFAPNWLYACLVSTIETLVRKLPVTDDVDRVCLDNRDLPFVAVHGIPKAIAPAFNRALLETGASANRDMQHSNI